MFINTLYALLSSGRVERVDGIVIGGVTVSLSQVLDLNKDKSALTHRKTMLEVNFMDDPRDAIRPPWIPE